MIYVNWHICIYIHLIILNYTFNYTNSNIILKNIIYIYMDIYTKFKYIKICKIQLIYNIILA